MLVESASKRPQWVLVDDQATVASMYLRGSFVVDIVGQLPWQVLLARFGRSLDFIKQSWPFQTARP